MRLLLAAALVLAGSGGGATTPPRSAVLVELFTSEGCSSCPPADALLARLLETQPIANAEIVPLALHVDYWDRLGWKDPFASAAYSRRQEGYSGVFGPDRVYTPQMIVDGAAEFTGSDEGRAFAAISEAAGRPHLAIGIRAETRGDTMRISVDAPAAPPDSENMRVMVAIVEDGLTSVVKRGENAGRTLAHAAVARRLEAIGALDRDAFTGEGQWKVDPRWRRVNLRVVAFAQGEKTRRVYGAAQATPR